MNKETRKVSIIVPVYNAEECLSDCIDSIITQDYTNIELILINDGSSDGSGNICESYMARDSRIVYKSQENSGVSATRNHGLDVSTGDYVMFVDSDDRLEPSAVGSMVFALESSDADLCICGYNIATKEGLVPHLIKEESVLGINNIAAYFSLHHQEAIASSLWAKLYKKSLLSHRFNRSITMGEDLLFNLEYIKHIEKVQAIDKAFYWYNKMNVNSLTNNFKPSYYKQDIFVTSQWLLWIKQFKDVDQINMQYRIANYYYCGLLSIFSNSDKKERKALINELTCDGVAEAVNKTSDKFGFMPRLMLRLALKKRYSLLSFVCVSYLKAKKIKKSITK